MPQNDGSSVSSPSLPFDPSSLVKTTVVKADVTLYLVDQHKLFQLSFLGGMSALFFSIATGVLGYSGSWYQVWILDKSPELFDRVVSFAVLSGISFLTGLILVGVRIFITRKVKKGRKVEL